MTLLVSLYTSEGIVYAADSQVTVQAAPGVPTRQMAPQRKVLPARRVGVAREGGVVGYFGLAQVAARPLDEWLRERISDFDGSKRVQDLAIHLRDGLNADATAYERKYISGLHVGGFEQHDGAIVPVMIFLRNAETYDEVKGKYSNLRDWWCDEHFPKPLGGAPKDVRQKLRVWEAGGFPYWFRNGDLAMATHVWEGIRQAVTEIADAPGFGLPRDLAGFVELARAIVSTTRQLYPVLYTGGAPLIGGHVYAPSISWPT